MMKNTMSEAAQSAAAAILTSATWPLDEALQYIQMYITDNEDKHPAAAGYMKEVLTCLCAQITCDQITATPPISN
jgi:hypothetical protein